MRSPPPLLEWHNNEIFKLIAKGNALNIKFLNGVLILSKDYLINYWIANNAAFLSVLFQRLNDIVYPF